MRVQLTFPDNVLYNTMLTVQIGDLNYGNHLANDAILRLAHEVRVRWLMAEGYTELDAGGVGLIMADAMVQYLAQSFYGDELDAQMAVGECARAGFALYTKFTRQSDHAVIAVVKTGMVCFDYRTQKVAPIPNDLQALLSKPTA